MVMRQRQEDLFVQDEYEESADEISADELWAEIDQKAQLYFNVSGPEFARLYSQGAIPDNFAASELGFLLRCIDDSFVPA